MTDTIRRRVARHQAWHGVQCARTWLKSSKVARGPDETLCIYTMQGLLIAGLVCTIRAYFVLYFSVTQARDL